MKHLAMLAAAAATALLLGGCATTIRSDVTAFNDWPAQMPDKSYAFVAPQGPDDTLEYRSYQVLVGNEMARLGFTQAADGRQPNLLVRMNFITIDRPLRVVQAADPFMAGRYWGPGWGMGAGRYGWGGYSRFGYGSLFYDPFRYGPVMEEHVRHDYERQLRVSIDSAAGHKLFDVTVQNISRVRATPHVMPALVRSAFTGFPGQSGVPRRIDLKIEPKTDTTEVAAARAD